jgi:hypothetical protein
MPMPSLGAAGESPALAVRVPAADKEEIRRRAKTYGVKPSVYVRAVLDVHLGRRCCVVSLSSACTHLNAKSRG